MCFAPWIVKISQKFMKLAQKAFRPEIRNFPKFWKNRNPDFSYRNGFRTSSSIWMNLVNFWAMITFHGANSISNLLAFHSFYFGARWVRALEVRARYFPILTEKFIFSGEKFRKKSCKLIKLQLKFKRAHPTRAKIKAMKSYKNLDAICTMKRDHSSKIEQIHPNRTTCTKSILILKNHVFFFKIYLL